MSKKILIIDDEKVIRELLFVNLQQTGYEVSLASNGEEALDLVRWKFFDIIMLDLVMPKMYGLEFIKELKDIRYTIDNKKPAVILMTAFSANELVEEAKTLGAVTCIYKPFDVKEVLNTINNVIQCN
ncbi:MAG: hypothetical protein A2252_00120 [Elusimicrobia bacterium RIFOXYA2_FULL_39_19]|nr:MAG: hypothetical protein A2252_00120 [Elusimicrobia bacterium RIFOXYA2_FULL_39_19]